MFTGIVEEVGEVVDVTTGTDSAVLRVRGPLIVSDATLGASIAVNGVCLTVTAHDEQEFSVDVMQESLDRSSLGDLSAGSRVNLERAVRADGRLGGHIVQGHVDGVGEVVDVKKDETEWRTRIRPPAHLMEYSVPQGSVAVDGVSLTLASVGEDWFEVALIPTTLQITTLGLAEVGARVNLEADYVAKTVVHWLRLQQQGRASTG